jgi:hypothetical protein
MVTSIAEHRKKETLGLPEAEHKCISYKVVATVVSPSSLANPGHSGCTCRLQYSLKIAECARLTIEVRRIKNFLNQMIINP